MGYFRLTHFSRRFLSHNFKACDTLERGFHSIVRGARLGSLSAIAVCMMFGLCEPAAAQTTGTFIDRQLPTDLRVVSYNVFRDTIFADRDAIQADKFARVMTALDPDIVNLQEIYVHSAADVVDLMNNILPLGESDTWHAHKAFDNVIASKFPLSLQETNTTPASPRNIAIALVDLPDMKFHTDFYFMNNHFRCCGDAIGGPEDRERQRQADALVNWMRDAHSPGGSVDLPAGTPMAVVGDLNIVGSLDPLNTLISGNIVNKDTYGPDAPPDWDATPLADALPLHNGSGPADYTWRDDAQIYDPGRLDFILYTDSAASVGNKFVLNTVTMSPAERAATGLQTYDITLDQSGVTYDHLPLIVDFRFPLVPLPGDYDSDGSVTSSDYDVWRADFGTTKPAADGNHDGIVDAADYVVWRNALAAGATGAQTTIPVPEPASNLLFVMLGCTLAAIRPRALPHREQHVLTLGDCQWTSKK
jgi:endonuclease/exonuclease/phosphatase family metal-dependent hydrolase